MMAPECDELLEARRQGFVDALVSGQFVDEAEATRRARRFYPSAPAASVYTADPQIIHVASVPASRFPTSRYNDWLRQFKTLDEFHHWLDQCEARDAVVERKAHSRLWRRARWFLYRLGRHV